jgi:hypothetical protein
LFAFDSSGKFGNFKGHHGGFSGWQWRLIISSRSAAKSGSMVGS